MALYNYNYKIISEKYSYHNKTFPMYKRHGNMKDSLRIDASKYYLLTMFL